MNKELDQLAADNIRALAISMVEKANSGHPGGPMGGADYMHILYSEFFNFDPSDMQWPFRDRFFMDAGHLSSLMLSIRLSNKKFQILPCRLLAMVNKEGRLLQLPFIHFYGSRRRGYGIFGWWLIISKHKMKNISRT